MYIYIYVYTYVHTYTHVYECVYTYIYICVICACVYVYMANFQVLQFWVDYPMKRKVYNSSGSQRLYAIHLGLKGDLPALSKIGSFKRSFARGPKSATGGKSVGVCFLCLAGRETVDPPIDFENFSRSAPWRSTYLTELPYDKVPAVLVGLPWGTPSEGPLFFKHDFWHHWHNGVAKTFIASSFVIINTSGLLEGRSIDARFQSLTEDYKAFCKNARISPYLKELTRETFGMDSSKVFPKGSWNKAQVSTQLMLYLGDFCHRFVVDKSDDVLLLAIAALFDLGHTVI